MWLSWPGIWLKYYIIFADVPVVLGDSLHSPGHRAAQVAQVLPVDVLRSHLQDGLPQLWNRDYVLAFEFAFNEVPGILFRSGKLPGQLTTLKELFCRNSLILFIAWQRKGAHKGQKVVLKDLLVSFHIHGRIRWKEEDPSISISSSKSHLTIKLAGYFNVLTASQ